MTEPRRWRRSTLAILAPGQFWRAVDGYVRTPWGIDRRELADGTRAWIVTHLPSGRSVACVRSLAAGRELCARADALGLPLDRAEPSRRTLAALRRLVAESADLVVVDG